MGKDQELLDAARVGNFAVVEKLIFPKSKSSSLAASLGIRVGAYINCQDQAGYTPLHHASLNGHSTIVKILIDAGADVNVPDVKGSCPLHLAAWNGNSEIVRLLLTTGPNFASINEQNGDKETALHCAAQHGHTGAASILLENHCDPEIRNIRDESALDLASQYGRLDVVRILFSFHPKILVHSPERFTSLHLASRNGHRGVVELLLAHGADINKVGANGTALHEAALFGKFEVVSLLLKRGAETTCKDSSGRTALELVSQLDTQISREIGKLIVARIQDGEDYEPIPSIMLSTPQKSKLKKDVKRAKKLGESANISASTSSLSRNLSRSFGEADLAFRDSLRGRPQASASFRLSHISPSSSQSPTRTRLKAGLLRRTSSARSSRSLPRLASSSSFHGNRSLHSFSIHRKKSDAMSVQDWSVRQHHPSIDMFPVNTTQSSQSGRKTSVSEPSSPQMGPAFVTPIHTPDSPNFDDPLKRDDCVFLPGPPSPTNPRPAPKAIIPLKPPADDSTCMETSLSTQCYHGSSSSGDAQSQTPQSTTPASGNSDSDDQVISKRKSVNRSTVTGDSTDGHEKQAWRNSFNESLNAGTSGGSLSSLSDLKSPGAPKKPFRNKPLLNPPPLPPKPAHMVKKPRPPSPSNPPPEDDEISNGSESEVDETLGSNTSGLQSLEIHEPTSPLYGNVSYDKVLPHQDSTSHQFSQEFTQPEQSSAHDNGHIANSDQSLHSDKTSDLSTVADSEKTPQGGAKAPNSSLSKHYKDSEKGKDLSCRQSMKHDINFKEMSDTHSSMTQGSNEDSEFIDEPSHQSIMELADHSIVIKRLISKGEEKQRNPKNMQNQPGVTHSLKLQENKLQETVSSSQISNLAKLSENAKVPETDKKQKSMQSSNSTRIIPRPSSRTTRQNQSQTTTQSFKSAKTQPSVTQSSKSENQTNNPTLFPPQPVKERVSRIATITQLKTTAELKLSMQIAPKLPEKKSKQISTDRNKSLMTAPLPAPRSFKRKPDSQLKHLQDPSKTPSKEDLPSKSRSFQRSENIEGNIDKAPQVASSISEATDSAKDTDISPKDTSVMHSHPSNESVDQNPLPLDVTNSTTTDLNSNKDKNLENVFNDDVSSVTTGGTLSPIASPSPPFSPPSPKTAMIEVSSTLQKVIPKTQSPSDKTMHSFFVSSKLQKHKLFKNKKSKKSDIPTIKPPTHQQELQKKKNYSKMIESTSKSLPKTSSHKTGSPLLKEKSPSRLSQKVTSFATFPPTTSENNALNKDKKKSTEVKGRFQPRVNQTKKSSKKSDHSLSQRQSETVSSNKSASTKHEDLPDVVKVAEKVDSSSSNQPLPNKEHKLSTSRPKSGLTYTTTQVKRARICSTRSVTDIPTAPSYGEYDNLQNIVRTKRSSSLGPQVDTPLSKKSSHSDSSTQTSPQSKQSHWSSEPESMTRDQATPPNISTKSRSLSNSPALNRDQQASHSKISYVLTKSKSFGCDQVTPTNIPAPVPVSKPINRDQQSCSREDKSKLFTPSRRRSVNHDITTKEQRQSPRNRELNSHKETTAHVSSHHNFPRKESVPSKISISPKSGKRDNIPRRNTAPSAELSQVLMKRGRLSSANETVRGVQKSPQATKRTKANKAGNLNSDGVLQKGEGKNTHTSHGASHAVEPGTTRMSVGVASSDSAYQIQHHTPSKLPTQKRDTSQGGITQPQTSSPHLTPRIKPPLVRTPPAAIRNFQRPKKPTKPSSLLKPRFSPSESDSPRKAATTIESPVSDVSSVAAKSSLSLDTAEDWNDALSDRTDDMSLPKEVKKYKGLIRGSSLSYRSRFCGSRNAYDSDEFDYDYRFEPAYSRVNPSLQRDDDIRKTSKKNKTSSKTSRPTDLGNFPVSREFMEVDSVQPSSKTSFGEPGEKRRKGKQSLSHTLETVISQDDRRELYSRNSAYDNNNIVINNDQSETKRISKKSNKMTTAPAIPSPMSDGLPDFGTIVDTVTAVRSKTSPQESTSGFSSSSSSQSSTLAKQDPPTLNDNNDEWTQIANVMKSVGNSLNKGAVYAQEFEETFWKIMTGSELPRRVGTWLSDLNLSQYEEVLIGNGFDNISFLSSNILEEQDLIDMNIQNPSHRHRLLDSAKNLPKIKPLASYSESSDAPSTVVEWLQSIALEEHEDLFKKMGFITLEKASKLKDTEIAAIIPLLGHRKRLRASLGPMKLPKSRTVSQSSNKLKLKSSPPLPRSPLLDTVNFFKDYSQSVSGAKTSTLNTYGTTSSSSSALTNYSSLSDQVVPVAISEEPEPVIEETSQKAIKDTKSSTNFGNQENTADKTAFNDIFILPKQEDDLLTLAISKLTEISSKHKDTDIKNMNASDANADEIRVPNARRASYLSSNGELVLRPPNETTEEEGVNISSWCHDPEVLIRSCCNYQAYYLGSMLVRDVKGVESTVEACAKMKKSTDSMKKIPTVTLSISYKGVKFIDSKSKHEIAEHEIHNISFASQDADDLSTLAYITRDARTDHHYCHVFRVVTLDVAYEIILTLGQAFEIAYQLILKEKALKEGS